MRLAIFILPCLALAWAVSPISSNGQEPTRRAGAAVSAPQVPLAADKPAAKRKTIAMLVYPGFTALDLVGPHQVFSVLQGYQVQLVWKTKELVTSDSGLTVQPTMTFKDCPEELAVLFVPGGTTGTLKMMEDAEVLAFLKSRAKKSDYVTSVCTGSLVLGAAGLLKGYKATCHWGARDILKVVGAEPVDERVVWDRNRVTGAGVTAGIDFALSLAARLKDKNYAKAVQLMMEYEPVPPFKAGSPAAAGPELTTLMGVMFAPFLKSARTAAEKAKAGW